MPLPIGDIKLVCNNCGWSLVTTNMGDALLGKFFAECPKCGSKISWHTPSLLEKISPFEKIRYSYYVIKGMFNN